VQQRGDGQNSTEMEEQHGLDWLLTLWFYRDPEVIQLIFCSLNEYKSHCMKKWTFENLFCIASIEFDECDILLR
jgi:hypothetical protein